MMEPLGRLQAVLRGDDAATISRIDRYEVEREIGRGGMAVVYEAWDPQLGRRVAIKVLNDPSADRILKEASAAARLQHPNVVAVHEVGSNYIVMDLGEGETLDRAAPGIDLAGRVRIVETVARAVAYAHRQGVVHRDIKPGNILVGKEGRVLLTDFGLAKLVGNSDLTLTAVVSGTPGYMAPEQILGRGAGPSVDVWALGVLLYEMVAGRRPFEGETAGEVHDRILHHDPRPLRGPLGAVVARALARQPERRYANAADLAEDLVAWLAGRSLAGMRLRGWARRRPLALAAAVAALLAAAGWWAWQRRPAGKEPELTPEGALYQSASRRVGRAAYLIDRGLEPGPACAEGPEDRPDAPNTSELRSVRGWRMFMCGRWLRRRWDAAGTPMLENAERLLWGTSRGLARAFLGKLELSEQDFEERRATGRPLASDSWQFWGEARALAGDYVRGDEYLTKMESVGGHTDLRIRGRIRLAAGRFAEAAKDLQEAIEADPSLDNALRPDLERALRHEAVPSYLALSDPPVRRR